MVLGIILVVENDVVGHMFVILYADNFYDVDTVDVILCHLHRKCPAWT